MLDKPRRYDTGGGWGDAVNWLTWEKRRVVGWKAVLPRVGDYLFAPMESGKVGVFRFKKVDYQSDPKDMFFADVEDVGFEGECELPEFGEDTNPWDELRRKAAALGFKS